MAGLGRGRRQRRRDASPCPVARMHITSRALLLFAIGMLCSPCISEHAAGAQGGSGVPIPVKPLHAADPFNPAASNDGGEPWWPAGDAGRSWTNDRDPPRRDGFGRFVFLPSKDTQPYTSFFSISGRSCGYLYVAAEASLPRTGAAIRLSADTAVSFSVLQVKSRGAAVVGTGLAAGRIYAYICSADGQYHPLAGGSGRWTYDVWQRAETGLPTYVDSGVVAAPHFVAVPGGSEPPDALAAAAASDPCADRADWRSMDHQLSCENYRVDGRERNWCTDEGYIDPTIVNPRDKTANIQWGIPAHRACPTACRTCMGCTLNATDFLVADLVERRRRENIVINGCRVGYNCPHLLGAPAMDLGVLAETEEELKRKLDRTWEPNYLPLPDFDSTLTAYLVELKYTCKFTPSSSTPQTSPRLLADVDIGVVFQERFLFRVFSATAHSVLRYTLDGSDPTMSHGMQIGNGDAIELRKSAQVKAIAYLDPATHVAILQSRVAMLPFVRIRIGLPALKILNVGHYRRAWGNVQEECAANRSWVTTHVSSDFQYVRSNGCPRSDWSTENSLNFSARHQAWQIPIPLEPRLAFSPLPLQKLDGIIGVARDGVPIFAPPANADDPALDLELKQVDACGGLAMSIRVVCEGGEEAAARVDGAPVPVCLFDSNHHGKYHYRVRPICLDAAENDEADGHSGLLGMMIDGIPLYGIRDVGGLAPVNLDSCGGHVDVGRPWYHYHASPHYPYTVGCLRGCIDPQAVLLVNPDLAAEVGDSCSPAETQPHFQSVSNLSWIAAPPVSETALMMEGNYEGSVSVEVACPMHPGGLASVRFTTNGEEPAVGGAPGQGFGHGSAIIIVTEKTVIKARCEAPDMEPSAVIDSGVISVLRVAYNPLWFATMGFWNFTDPSTFVGQFTAPRDVVQGGCPEIEGTHIFPAYVSDLSDGIGRVLFVPPDCKAGLPDWDVKTQPSLSSIFGEHRGVRGVLLGTSLAVNGLRTAGASVEHLLDAQKLPQEELSVEVWAAIMGGAEGALAGVIYKASGFLGKGWYVGWETDTSAALPLLHTVTFVLTLSTEGNDNYGRGGVATVRATVPKMLVGQHWVHVGGTYDGREIVLYVNGTRMGAERACRREYCGRITYPVRDDRYVTTAVPFSVGALEYNGRHVRHHGYIALVRVMGQSLGEEQMHAAAARLALPLALEWCPPGTYGPYDGLHPCLPCLPGSQASLNGQTACTRCPRGFYSDVAGAEQCQQCPDGTMTKEDGCASMSNCTGPDYCQSLLHNCHTFADCVSTDGSFQCACHLGFSGDGVECMPLCGDGITVQAGSIHDEECDDGNTLPSDGCGPTCRIEAGFACSVRADMPDQCTCELDALECCVREYSHCLVGEGHCAADCLAELTACQHAVSLAAPHRPASLAAQLMSPNASVDDHESKAAGDSTGGMRGLNLTEWNQAEASQCNRTLMKSCRKQLVACQDAASQRTHNDQTAGSSSVSLGDECTAASCLDDFVHCMQVIACVARGDSSHSTSPEVSSGA